VRAVADARELAYARRTVSCSNEENMVGGCGCIGQLYKFQCSMIEARVVFPDITLRSNRLG